MTYTRTALLAAAALAAPAAASAADRAVAVLQPSSGSGVSGTVWFTETPAGVKVSAQIKGLAAGPHGFHVHEFGDCSAPDATSAGGHFNPTGDPHAGPDASKRHVGDLGNVEAKADGTAALEREDKHLKLKGAHAIVGHAVIVHAKADDLKTQPTGDAGGRLACGVVGVAKAQ
jgi:Cu-Zn family superoxide dismutase